MPEKKLTVVQVLPALKSGGVERGTLEVGKHLIEHGHRSIIISAGGRMVEQLEREGSEHVTWDIGKKSLWTLRLIPRLRQFLIENKVDILHARSRMPAWICYLAWKGMNPNTRPRFVTTVHGPYSVNAYSKIMTKGERVIVISKMIRDYVLKNYPDTNPDKLRLIYRGVSPTEFPYGYKPDQAWLDGWYAQYPQTAGKKLLTLPARITRWKGQEDFIQLMLALKDTHPEVHGLIVGDADPRRQPYMEELKAKVKTLGLNETITFTGHRNDLREIMSISHIVFSLSREPEAFGRTTLEALSLGVPVIGYDHGGVGEQLTKLEPEGRVDNGNFATLAALCQTWLVHPLQPVPANPFTLGAMQHDTFQIYAELASRDIPEGHTT